MNYIGIDIGGTQVKIGIVNAEGVVEKKAAYDVAFDNYETPLIETVKSSLLQFAKENGINKEDTPIPIISSLFIPFSLANCKRLDFTVSIRGVS